MRHAALARIAGWILGTLLLANVAWSGAAVPSDGPQAAPDPFPWGDPDTARIRPGVRIFTGNPIEGPPPEVPELFHGWCTLAFLLEDAVNATGYALTAGHCTRNENDVVGLYAHDNPLVFTARPDPFGVVVKRSPPFPGRPERLDYALIRIDSDRVHDAHPKMIGHNGPTGVASAAESNPLEDTAQIHGWGIGFHARPETRSRSGPLTFHDARYWNAAYPANDGDSGAPVLHGESGRALGLHMASPPGHGKPVLTCPEETPVLSCEPSSPDCRHGLTGSPLDDVTAWGPAKVPAFLRDALEQTCVAFYLAPVGSGVGLVGGPTVEGILNDLHASGFANLRLATVGSLSPDEARP